MSLKIKIAYKRVYLKSSIIVFIFIHLSKINFNLFSRPSNDFNKRTKRKYVCKHNLVVYQKYLSIICIIFHKIKFNSKFSLNLMSCKKLLKCLVSWDETSNLKCQPKHTKCYNFIKVENSSSGDVRTFFSFVIYLWEFNNRNRI